MPARKGTDGVTRYFKYVKGVNGNRVLKQVKKEVYKRSAPAAAKKASPYRWLPGQFDAALWKSGQRAKITRKGVTRRYTLHHKTKGAKTLQWRVVKSRAPAKKKAAKKAGQYVWLPGRFDDTLWKSGKRSRFTKEGVTRHYTLHHKTKRAKTLQWRRRA
jgi:hypothetical protein